LKYEVAHEVAMDVVSYVLERDWGDEDRLVKALDALWRLALNNATRFNARFPPELWFGKCLDWMEEDEDLKTRKAWTILSMHCAMYVDYGRICDSCFMKCVVEFVNADRIKFGYAAIVSLDELFKQWKDKKRDVDAYTSLVNKFREHHGVDEVKRIRDDGKSDKELKNRAIQFYDAHFRSEEIHFA
jgi:hypothetical protein